MKYLLLITTIALFNFYYSFSKNNPDYSINKRNQSFINNDSTDFKFTRADSLRGSLMPERKWWDVQKYELNITPNIEEKNISGFNLITYKIIQDNNNLKMQIDLQEPMMIDSIFFDSGMPVDFIRDGNVWYLNMPFQKAGTENSVLIYFHGTPKESRFPPWDGGWVWKKDDNGNPFISAACQGFGASSWYPCKDHQSDEPDNGAVITINTSADFTAIANGRFEPSADQTTDKISYRWIVKNPINSYCIIPYIGKYSDIKDSYQGEKGILDIDVWVLNYNTDKASSYLIPEIKKMLEALEYWYGPYPFYEDGYKLVEAPFAGMEHQSAIAYGNKFELGFWGRDRSGTGHGLKWDYMVVHESAHEWFGNSITSNDIADMWIHETFADYAETLYTEYWFGKDAANEYNKGLRKAIFNKKPVIGYYNVNKEGSPDMYAKGSNMIHSIRHGLNDDEKFRTMMREITKTFYHKNVDTKQIEEFISGYLGFDYGKVFDQFLRNIKIPELEIEISKSGDQVKIRYVNCIDGFNMPLTINSDGKTLKIIPDTQWKTLNINKSESILFDKNLIENNYYLTANILSNTY